MRLVAISSSLLVVFAAGCFGDRAEPEPRIEVRKPVIEVDEAADFVDPGDAEVVDPPPAQETLSATAPSSEFQDSLAAEEIEEPAELPGELEPASVVEDLAEADAAAVLQVERVIEEELRKQELLELRGRLADANVDVRFAAVTALADRVAQEPQAREALIAALDDDHKEVVISARQSLREAGAVAVPELVAALQDDSARVRLYAVQTLAGMEPGEAAEAIDSLLGVLEQGDDALRAAAVAALARCGGESEAVVSAVIEALKDPDGKVRVNAARALGTMGADGPQAVAALERALGDKDYWAARAARQALRSIAPGPAKKYPLSPQ